MKKITLLIILTLAALCTTWAAFAQITNVPQIMSAPVVLYDEANNILPDADYSVTLKLKDSSNNTLYSEEQVVTVKDSVAHITVGNGYAVGSNHASPAGGLSYDAFNVDGDITLEILVSGQSTAQEIAVLGSQPFSFVSQYALGVANDSITSNKVMNGTIKSEDLDPSFLDELQSGGSVTVTSSGGATTISMNAKNVAVDSDIGLNNASGTTVQTVLKELDGAIDNLRGVDLEQNIETLNNTLNGITTSASSLSSTLAAHTGAKSGVHGVTGNVVGTTDTQTLSNKTLAGGTAITDNVTVSDSVTIDGTDISSLATQVAANTSNIADNTTSIANNATSISNNAASITDLDSRVTAIETQPTFSESDISQSIKPFAYGTATMNEYGSGAASCSGYNIDSSNAGSCKFTSPASSTDYVVVATPSASYSCGSGMAASDWFRLNVSRTSGSAFNITAYCEGSSSNPATVDFVVFYNH